MTGKKMGIEIGKLPPQVVEFEEAVLGGILLEKEAMEEVVEIITPESFYKDEHQKIYAACLTLFNRNKPIDYLTVIDELRKRKELDIIGGPVYLTELTSNIASAAHIEYHARIIQQKYIQRELIKISTEIQNRAFDESIDVSELIDYSQTEINQIATGNLKKMGVYLWEIGKKRILELEEISKNKLKFTGVKCWEKVNKFTGGWQNGNLILLAGRPGDGKTRIAQEIAKIAANNDQPVAFFSMEMADKELYDRELSAQTGIENMYIRQANFIDADWQKIDSAQKNIEGLPIIIDDTPALSVNEFRAKARSYKKKFNIQMIIVDYLQLMKSPEFRKFREQEISSISGTLKSVAKELDIPIIALSQLSREIDKRPDKTPRLSDLRESGSLEQDADCVIFIHRPEKYFTDSTPQSEIDKYKKMIILIFAKYRNGSIGDVRLWRSDKWSTIYEYKNDETDFIKAEEEDAF